MSKLSRLGWRRKMLLGNRGGASFVGAYDAIPNLVHVYEPGRRTLSAYTGALVRLRRSSDNAEADFGYVEATGELDTAAIAAWKGAGTLYVVTVYDQKGSDNITQATADRQPAYSATAQNSHAGMIFDGSATLNKSDYLQGAFATGGALSQPYTIYAIAQLDAALVNTGTWRTLYDGLDADKRSFLQQYIIPEPDVWAIGAGSNLLDSATDSNMNLWAALDNCASSSFWANNVPKISGDAGTANMEGLVLGGILDHADARSWRGPILSLVIADPSHTDAQREAMQTAMNAYWAVYPFDIPPLPEGEPDFAIVHIPDTQEYTGYVAEPPIEPMQAMTEWIADNLVSEKIAAVLHTGDIVIPADETTWGFANSALDTIDAIAALPVFYCTGNHDYDGEALGTLSSERLSTVWNTYIGQAHFTGKSWWSGGFYEEGKSENAYLLVTLGGVDHIILSLEFGPRQAVVDWANTILTTYAARDAIIITHAYLFQDATRYTTGDIYNPHDIITGSTDTHDGEELWTELVKLHSNIVMVLCGHVRGVMYQTSTGDGGNIVNEILNGHDAPDGHLGIIRFYLAQNKVAYTRYSPYLDRVDYQVTLDYKAT